MTPLQAKVALSMGWDPGTKIEEIREEFESIWGEEISLVLLHAALGNMERDLYAAFNEGFYELTARGWDRMWDYLEKHEPKLAQRLNDEGRMGIPDD